MIFGRRVREWRAVAMWMGLFGASIGVFAADAPPTQHDTLVYKDGDRVQGKLVEQTAELIVFNSPRFGELRVSAVHAVVIKAETTAALAPPPIPAAPPPQATPSQVAKAEAAQAAQAAETAEEERVRIWELFSPAVLTAKVREYFGPWRGRVAFSTEVISDVAERHNTSWEGTLRRKWKNDDVQFNGRYDYSDTDDVTSTDLIKGWGTWRHDFNKAVFGQYRPTVEWNRASKLKSGVPNDYVLLQQEIGAGVHVLTKPSRKLRVGVSQNLFSTWNSAPAADDTSRGVVSVFEEVELTFPWRITLSQRAVWYPVRDQPDGLEGRIDLNKKLTETLSTAVRHEFRRHNPDGTAQDYDRLKLLFAFDF